MTTNLSLAIQKTLAVALTVAIGVFATAAALAQKSEFEWTPAHSDFHEVTLEEVQTALNNLHAAPRLLLTDEKIAEVREKIESDDYWAEYYAALVKARMIKQRLNLLNANRWDVVSCLFRAKRWGAF